MSTLIPFPTAGAWKIIWKKLFLNPPAPLPQFNFPVLCHPSINNHLPNHQAVIPPSNHQSLLPSLPPATLAAAAVVVAEEEEAVAEVELTPSNNHPVLLCLLDKQTGILILFPPLFLNLLPSRLFHLLLARNHPSLSKTETSLSLFLSVFAPTKSKPFKKCWPPTDQSIRKDWSPATSAP